MISLKTQSYVIFALNIANFIWSYVVQYIEENYIFQNSEGLCPTAPVTCLANGSFISNC